MPRLSRTALLIVIGTLNVLVVYGYSGMPVVATYLVSGLMAMTFGYLAGDHPAFSTVVLSIPFCIIILGPHLIAIVVIYWALAEIGGILRMWIHPVGRSIVKLCMPASFKAELVGCFGQPVAENPTGAMQEAGFRALDLNWRYLTIEVPPDRLADAVAGVRAFGMRGFNLTIPHKVAVMQYLDAVSPDAALIGAVNTVRREGDRLIGENTDGKGFLKGVREDAGIDPKGKHVVVLGAGGAARAIVTELALAGAADILVVNRGRERGESMAADLASRTGAPIRFQAWDGELRIGPDTDLLVQATSIGLFPDVDAMPAVSLAAAAPHLLVCDVVFNPPETRLLAAARKRGMPVLDGLSMLVHQGTIGFELWTGRKAPETAMKRALRAALGLEQDGGW